MKKTSYIIFPLAFIALFTQCQSSTSNKEDKPSDEKTEQNSSTNFLGDVTIRGAIKHKNFEVFLIEGKTNADNVEYVSLKRAMENNWVKIAETSDVNELEISNTSKHTVFIHAGDIVKGGKQDRTLTYDVLVSPGTKGMKISSFCVESSRWSQRGDEEAVSFSENTKMLSSRGMKISSKKNKEQSSVWSEVAETQDRLNYNVSAYYNKSVDVKANASASSLELALDNKDLQKMMEEYKSHFKNLDLENVVGFAYAINGELYNIDIYNNKQLFDELFDKLLTAAIVEAITEFDVKAKKFSYLKLDKLVAQLKLEEDSKTTSEKLNKRTRWESKEDDVLVVFTSIDCENNDKWLHRNVIVKGEVDSSPKNQQLNDNRN